MTVRISKKHAEELKALGVAVVYLYGSRADGTAGEYSDYDIGVVFADPRDAHLNLDRFQALYAVVSEIFPDTARGPKLDIALLQRANAKLQLDAVQYGTTLFESEARARADYEESVVKQYDDYRFLEREYEDATFAAFRAA